MGCVQFPARAFNFGSLDIKILGLGSKIQDMALSKKKTKREGGEGVKMRRFWDKIVYGQPPTVFLASREYQLNKSSLGYTFILGTLLIILIFYYWSWRTSFAAEIDLSLQHMCTRNSFFFSPALSIRWRSFSVQFQKDYCQSVFKW